jgi:hypothetical protein
MRICAVVSQGFSRAIKSGQQKSSRVFFWWSRGGLGISLGRPMVAKQNGVRQSRVDYIARVAMANLQI